MGIVQTCINGVSTVKKTVTRIRRKAKGAPHKAIPAVSAVAAAVAIMYYAIDVRDRPQTPIPIEWSSSGLSTPVNIPTIPETGSTIKIDRNTSLEIIPKQCWDEFRYPAS